MFAPPSRFEHSCNTLMAMRASFNRESDILGEQTFEMISCMGKNNGSLYASIDDSTHLYTWQYDNAFMHAQHIHRSNSSLTGIDNNNFLFDVIKHRNHSCHSPTHCHSTNRKAVESDGLLRYLHTAQSAMFCLHTDPKQTTTERAKTNQPRVK